MKSGHWVDRLSDYLDGELADGERRAVERHLAECEACSSALSGLRSVVAAARAEPIAPPAHDLWPEIRRRLSPRGPAVAPLERRRRLVLSIPQSLAAGVALMALSAGVMWVALAGHSPEPSAAALTDPVAGPVLAGYEPAMLDLEREYERRRADLDPETIRVVERNLAIIDAAIVEARQALAADPASGFLHGYLAESMRRRMSLLRQAASI